MARKKKDNTLKYIIWPFKTLGILIYKGTKFLIKKIKRNQKRYEIEKSKPKAIPKVTKFEEVKKIEGKLENFERVLEKGGKIGIILGARGSGKSALGMRILENIKASTKKTTYTIGFKEKEIPSWIKPLKSLDNIKNNSFILIDESGITFSSRESMSKANKLLSKLILIARHKNLSILFITQNSSNIEINTIRQADYLLLKPSSLLQLDFERKKIKDIYKDVEKEFKKFKDKTGLTYVYSDSYRGFITNTLPTFWSEKLSKSFSE